MAAEAIPQEVLNAFAAELAKITDEKERSRYLNKAKMLAVNSAPAEAFKAEVRSMREYLASEIETPPSLVWPTIAVRGEITTTLGRAGKGKTTYNLNRIFSWSAGRPLFPGWMDKEGMEYLSPDGPLKTLIAENEGNAGMFHAKMNTMLRNGPLTNDEQELALDNLFVHGNGGYSGLKLDNDEGVKKLRSAIEACEPDIVFIEPFRSLWKGDENSSTDMALVVDNIITMATDYNCAVILSHHERKSGVGDDGEKMSAGRGSTVLEGAVALMENFESVVGGDYREISWSKARYLPEPPPTRMEYTPDNGWYSWVPQEAIEDSIYEALREAGDESLNVAALVEELGETKKKISETAGRMAKDGRIKKLPSQTLPNGGGSTGARYRLITSNTESNGGLTL